MEHLKALFQRLRFAFRSYLGWVKCPVCGQQRLILETNNPINPEGPPIFTRWHCFGCNRYSDWGFSKLMDDAAQEFGFPSAHSFFDHHMNGGAEREQLDRWETDGGR